MVEIVTNLFPKVNNCQKHQQKLVEAAGVEPASHEKSSSRDYMLSQV
jgi:hypothetical protein